MLPLISVIIPVYNREGTIRRAIDSVLNQTYTNIEVIVVDDCSIDNSRAVLAEYDADSRVRLILMSKNGGANRARNEGIKCAVGEYIAFQDSDDEWLPEKLEKQFLYMMDNNYRVVYCPYIFLGDEIEKQIPSKEMCGECLEGRGLVDTLRERNVISTQTLIVHKDVLTLSGFFDEDMPRLQDYELVIRIAQNEPIGFIREPLVKVYRVDESISTSNEKLEEAFLLILQKHGDFIDNRHIWSRFVEECGLLKKVQIDLNRLDETIERVVRVNSHLSKEICLSIVTEYLYERYRYADFIAKLRNCEVAVYGAGYWGKRVVEELCNLHLTTTSFLVTHKNGMAMVQDIPVNEVSDWNRKDIPVIIAVAKKEMQKEMIHELECNEYSNFVVYPIG